MGPFFTSRAEWHALSPAGERTYVRSGAGWVIRASLLGYLPFAVVTRASVPYWSSLPVLLTFAASLAVCAGGSVFLFRREWRACHRVYGIALPERISRPCGLAER